MTKLLSLFFSVGTLANHTMLVYAGSFLAAAVGIGTLMCAVFLTIGGYSYITSSGRPDTLVYAKLVIRNALIGLGLLAASAVIVLLLTHMYTVATPSTTAVADPITSIQTAPTSSGLVDVLLKAIAGLLQNIIDSAAIPFLKALDYFTQATPLMAANSTVLKLWLILVGISDAILIITIALLSLHIMSAATVGLEEIELKHLLPQIAGIFLLFNTSIFAVDGVISLSNVMIRALNASFGSLTVWDALTKIAEQSSAFSIAALIIMVVFLALTVILVIYYLSRLVTLYLGAILSPLVILLWLVPGFRDFSISAVKLYLSSVFVLFIHVTILHLATGLFAGILSDQNLPPQNAILALLMGVSTIVVLLKTQGVLSQLSYIGVGPKMIRSLGSQFLTGVNYLSGTSQASRHGTVIASRY